MDLHFAKKNTEVDREQIMASAITIQVSQTVPKNLVLHNA